uniref:Uncharacterized protein n=1 Tax=Arundo donax TaxID=35708 RepID=A0A0A9E741_ARUDO
MRPAQRRELMLARGALQVQAGN